LTAAGAIYLELLALFDRQATEDDLIRYLKS
jgi:hypothetical protein